MRVCWLFVWWTLLTECCWFVFLFDWCVGFPDCGFDLVWVCLYFVSLVTSGGISLVYLVWFVFDCGGFVFVAEYLLFAGIWVCLTLWLGYGLLVLCLFALLFDLLCCLVSVCLWVLMILLCLLVCLLVFVCVSFNSFWVFIVCCLWWLVDYILMKGLCVGVVMWARFLLVYCVYYRFVCSLLVLRLL